MVMYLFRFRWVFFAVFIVSVFFIGVWALDISFQKPVPPPVVQKVKAPVIEVPYFYFED